MRMHHAHIGIIPILFVIMHHMDNIEGLPCTLEVLRTAHILLLTNPYVTQGQSVKDFISR